MSSLPALLLAFEQLKTAVVKRYINGVEVDPLMNMGLHLANDRNPTALNRDGNRAPIAPFATYTLHRSSMSHGVQFKTYTENDRTATVLFITPDSKYTDVYTPFINAWKRGDPYSTPITYQWPENMDSVYSESARAHLTALGTQAASAAKEADVDAAGKRTTSIGSVFVFVKVGTMEANATSGNFLCLGRFEVKQSRAGTTTLMLLPAAAAVPLSAFHSVRNAATLRAQPELATPTFDDEDMRSVISDLSYSAAVLRASDVRPEPPVRPG